MERADRTFFAWNAAVSTVAVGIIGYILGRDAAPEGSVDLSFVPALNATCNALASLCLITGWVAIRRKAVQVHRLCMVTALAMASIGKSKLMNRDRWKCATSSPCKSRKPMPRSANS